MVGGGIAAILALQTAGAFSSYKEEEPSYTVRQQPTYPCSSPTASVTTCATACEFVSHTGCIGGVNESRP